MEATCDRKSRKETLSPSFSNSLELDLNKSPDGGQNAGDNLLGPLICALPTGLGNDPSYGKNLGLDNSPEEGESGAATLPTQVSLQPGIANGIVLNFQGGKNAILIGYWSPTISETDLLEFQLCETCSLPPGLEYFQTPTLQEKDASPKPPRSDPLCNHEKGASLGRQPPLTGSVP